MLQFLRITLVLSLLAVMVLPILVELVHHHDGPAAHEETCQGDCGCVCHVRTFAVTPSDVLPLEARVSFAVDNYHTSRPEADPAAVDHPPELNS